MSVVRAILLKAEAMDERARRLNDFEMPGLSSKEVGQYLQMMREAGLIEANLLVFPEDDGVVSGTLDRITWAGHDFLDSIRDESVWSIVKSKLASVGGSVSLELVKALGAQVLRGKLGLPEG